MSARTIAAIAGVCWIAGGLLPGVAWGQGAARLPEGLDSKPIGKVQAVTGAVTI